MCWIAYDIEELNPKIAEDNIPVEKLVKVTDKGVCYSAYYGVPYEMNNIYRERINKSIRAIHDGFHSYKECKFVIRNGNIFINSHNHNPVFALDRWFKDELAYNINFGIMFCIIPKGCTYYENQRGEVVSDAIKPIYCFKIK